MREVFELSRKQHLSHREIAEKLAISEQTVSKHVTPKLRICARETSLKTNTWWFDYLVASLQDQTDLHEVSSYDSGLSKVSPASLKRFFIFHIVSKLIQ